MNKSMPLGNVDLDTILPPDWEDWNTDLDDLLPPGWDDDFTDPSQITSNALFTLYDSAQGPTYLLEQIIGNIDGITIDLNSVQYIGAAVAASTFNSVDFGHNATLGGSGILLTSGNGAPALNNTEGSHSVALGTPGDSQLDQLAQDAFPGAGATEDASILAFSFSVNDPSVESISFDLLFGSEEFPSWIDSSYVDIAAVTVNGQNYAYLDGDPNKPLSIIGATVSDGRFIDNTQNMLPIEYNGMTPRMTVTIPLEAGVETYNVRLGVADTGDRFWDSGLFISNFQTLDTGFGGTYVNVQAGDGGEELAAAGPNTATLFIGGAGNDTMTGSLAADAYDLTKGGQNIVQGSLAQLDQDTIVGFTPDDTLKFLDVQFGLDDLTVTMGSAILEVDVDGDGVADSTVTLEGDFSQAQFQVVQVGGNSLITFEQIDTTLNSLLGVTSFMFNYAPDQASLGRFEAILADNPSFYALGTDLAHTDAYKSQFAPGATLADKIDVILTRLGLEQGDQGYQRGTDFITTRIEKDGIAEGQVMMEIGEKLLYGAPLEHLEEATIVLQNKITVSQAYLDSGIEDYSNATLPELLNGITADQQTVDDALIGIAQYADDFA